MCALYEVAVLQERGRKKEVGMAVVVVLFERTEVQQPTRTKQGRRLASFGWLPC
jgi:hypothetical protein